MSVTKTYILTPATYACIIVPLWDKKVTEENLKRYIMVTEHPKKLQRGDTAAEMKW